MVSQEKGVVYLHQELRPVTPTYMYGDLTSCSKGGHGWNIILVKFRHV